MKPTSILLTSVLILLFPLIDNCHGSSCLPACNPPPPNCDINNFFLPCSCTTQISWAGCTMQGCLDTDAGSEGWYACYCNSSSTYTGRCYSTGCTLPSDNGTNPNYMSAYNSNSPYDPTCKDPQCLGLPKNCTSTSMPMTDKTPCTCVPSAFPKQCEMQPCQGRENTYDQYQCICTPEAGVPCWNDMCSNGSPFSATSILQLEHLTNHP